MSKICDSSLPVASEYEVGWLCALQNPERVAAQALLDEKYEYENPPADTGRSGFAYTYGRMGKRKVVIACLSKGATGNMRSAQMAGPLKEYFKHMNIFILAGIAGGVPGTIHEKNARKNLHLGDVIVSSQSKGCSGVVSYTEIELTATDFPNVAIPHKVEFALSQAAGVLETNLTTEGPKILEPLWKQLNEKEIEVLKRPESNDVLYQADYEHVAGSNSCKDCDKTRRVERPLRKLEEPPVTHFGTVLSGWLVKNAVLRDALAAEHPGTLCFEMEAAGLDNSRCLVVRGICDYADTHKNKEWQGYAAASAAVVAKYILGKAEFYVGIQPETPLRGSPLYHEIELNDIPLGSVERFEGREAICSMLSTALIGYTENVSSKIFVLYGEPGCGKSAICNYFYKQTRTKYWAAWRINAGTVEAIEKDFENIAIENSLPPKSVRSTIDWLSKLKKYWLLIFDGADNSVIPLQDYIPSSVYGSILITTRDKQNCRFKTSGAEEVKALEEKDSVSLLLNIVSPSCSSNSRNEISVYNAATRVVQRLNNLPVGIVLAGTAIFNDGQHSIRTLDNRLEHFLQEINQPPSHSGHKLSKLWPVYAAIIQAMYAREVPEQKQLVEDAVDLLYFFAFLSSSKISLGIFKMILDDERYKSSDKSSFISFLGTSESESLPGGSEPRHNELSLQIFKSSSGAAEETISRMKSAITLLEENALVTVTPETHTTECQISLHSLVQECARVSRFSISFQEGDKCALRAIYVLAQAVLLRYEPADRTFRRSLLPHVEAIFQVYGGGQTALVDKIFRNLRFMDAANVILRVSMVYFDSSRIDVARRLQERVHDIAEREQHLQVSDELLLWARALLATSYHDLGGPGQRKQAMDLRILVKKGREHNLHLHSETPRELRNEDYLIALSNLADSYDEYSEYCQTAVDYREQILRYAETTSLGFIALEAKQRLARSYHQSGQRHKAFQLRRELYEEIEQQGTDWHSAKGLNEFGLVVISDLAESHCERGDWTKAMQMRETVLKHRIRLLGEDHYDTHAAKCNLALSHMKLGNYSTAIELRTQIFNANDRAFGFEHPASLTSYAELATAYVKEQPIEALRRRIRCLRTWQKVVAEHKETFFPELLDSMRAVARSFEKLMQHQDDEHQKKSFESALRLRSEVIEITKARCGENSIEVLKAKNEEADCYAFNRNHEDARLLREELQRTLRTILDQHLPSSDLFVERIYFKVLKGLASDYEKLADDYKRIPWTGSIPSDIEATPGSVRSNDSKLTLVSSGYSETDAEHRCQFQKSAICCREEILEICRRWSKNELDYNTLCAMTDLAKCYSYNEVGRKEEAIQLYTDALSILDHRDRLGHDHEKICDLRARLDHLLPDKHVMSWMEKMEEVGSSEAATTADVPLAQDDKKPLRIRLDPSDSFEDLDVYLDLFEF